VTGPDSQLVDRRNRNVKVAGLHHPTFRIAALMTPH
jgi:hypothetical protein